MNGQEVTFRVALVAGTVLTVVLSIVRAVEVLNGVGPTEALTVAFSGAVTVLLAMLAASHVTRR